MLGKKKTSALLGGFVKSENPFRPILKGVLTPDQLNSADIDVYSKKQIKCYIDNAIEANVGVAKELQKSLTNEVKEEISKLVPVTISDGESETIVYVSKSGDCKEILKAFDPLNNDNYFNDDNDEDNDKNDDDENSNFDEEEVISFIKEAYPAEEELVGKFGDGIVEFVQTLVDEDKVSFEDDIYSVSDDDDDDENEDDEDDSFIDADNDGENDNDEINDDVDTIEDAAEDAEQHIEEDQDEVDEKNANDQEEANEAEEALNNANDEVNENPFGGNDEENNDGIGDENGEGDEGDNNMPDDQNANVDTNPKYTPEQLEQFASKTATSSLIRFYSNSNDDGLKNIVKVELERRGVNPQTGEDAEQAKISQLRDWVNEYFSSYDGEDLRKYITDLISQSPSKRKELKDHYRSYYQMSNGGNSLLKIDEKEFTEWIEDTYLKNFSFGDLKDYAIRLLEQNPGEAKKLKGAYDASNEKIF